MPYSKEFQISKLKPIFGFVIVAVVLALSLIIDLVPRFHLGDSASYINTQIGAFIPESRSWTYGLMLGFVTRATHQLISMPLLQVLFSWLSYAVFVLAVADALRLRGRVALLIFVIGCLEPLGYFWSRAFMSDSAAQSIFMLLCAVLMARLNLVARFTLVFIAGLALLSLRGVYFAPTFAALIATTAWSVWTARTGLAIKSLLNAATLRSARPWLVAIAAFLAADFTYACVNTHMTEARRRSTNIADMEFLVTALSPLAGDQLDSTPLTPEQRVALLPLTYENRIANEWAPNGLVPMIHSHFASTEAARPAMHRLAIAIISHHPAGFVALVARQWSDYLNPYLVWSYHRKGWWSGAVAYEQPNELPDGVIETFRHWKVWPIPTPDLPAMGSAALSYFKMAGGVWSIILAVYATFGTFFTLWVTRRTLSSIIIFICSFSFLYLGEIAAASPDLITRYLMPIVPPLLYAFALAAAKYFPAQAQAQAQAPAPAPDFISPIQSEGTGAIN